MTFSEDKIEFMQAWNQVAGESSAWSGAVALAEAKAAQAYIQRRDDVASAFRELAKEFKQHEQSATSQLRAYIAEDERRRNAKTNKK